MSTLCAHEVGFAVRKKLWLHAGSIMNIIAFNHIIVLINNIFIKIISLILISVLARGGERNW